MADARAHDDDFGDWLARLTGGPPDCFGRDGLLGEFLACNAFDRANVGFTALAEYLVRPADPTAREKLVNWRRLVDADSTGDLKRAEQEKGPRHPLECLLDCCPEDVETLVDGPHEALVAALESIADSIVWPQDEEQADQSRKPVESVGDAAEDWLGRYSTRSRRLADSLENRGFVERLLPGGPTSEQLIADVASLACDAFSAWRLAVCACRVDLPGVDALAPPSFRWPRDLGAWRRFLGALDAAASLDLQRTAARLDGGWVPTPGEFPSWVVAGQWLRNSFPSSPAVGSEARGEQLDRIAEHLVAKPSPASLNDRRIRRLDRFLEAARAAAEFEGDRPRKSAPTEASGLESVATPAKKRRRRRKPSTYASFFEVADQLYSNRGVEWGSDELWDEVEKAYAAYREEHPGARAALRTGYGTIFRDERDRREERGNNGNMGGS